MVLQGFHSSFTWSVSSLPLWAYFLLILSSFILSQSYRLPYCSSNTLEIQLSQYLCTYCSSWILCPYIYMYMTHMFSLFFRSLLKFHLLLEVFTQSKIVSHALSVLSYILHAYHLLIFHLFYFCVFSLFISPTRMWAPWG